MIDFIVNLDSHGTIKTVKWASEEEMVCRGQSIYEIFDDKSCDKLMRQLENAKLKEEGNHDDSITLQILNDTEVIPLSLYVFPSLEDDLYTAVGISGQTKEPEIIQKLIADYNDVVNKMRMEVKKRFSQSEAAFQERLEELQKLNNELNNKRRSIEKANVELNSMNQQLNNQLIKDQLTGLVGRYYYWTGIEKMIETQPEKQGVFIFIDIDDFKAINDTYGHAAGDEYLKELANRLKALPLENVLRIRVSGDEFALYIHGLNEVSDHDLHKYWEMVSGYVSQESIEFNGMYLPVSVSMGMAVYRQDTNCVKKLIEYADFAMYRAKKLGKNTYYRFSMSEYEQHNTHDVYNKALDDIISKQDLYHVYQPIVSATDGSIYAYAALMRTNNEYFQNTSDLIETAFKESRYMELDAISFTQLIQDEKFLADKFVSKKLFIPHGPYALSRNKEIIQSHSHFPGQIVVELMHSQMMSLENVEEIQKTAKELNYKVAISNFRDGISNALSLLAAAPEFIKIDRQMMKGINRDNGKQKVVQSIVQYAHGQGSKVVAEGIETREEKDMALSLQVDFLQGFFLGEPQEQI